MWGSQLWSRDDFHHIDVHVMKSDNRHNWIISKPSSVLLAIISDLFFYNDEQMTESGLYLQHFSKTGIRIEFLKPKKMNDAITFLNEYVNSHKIIKKARKIVNTQTRWKPLR
jgi:hypothetical protein